MTTQTTDITTAGGDRLHGRQVELILHQLESLPTLPEVATRLLTLASSSSSQAQEVIDLIRSDQTLTARILSLASRVENGLRKEVRTIGKAVLMLGFEAVRAAVLSIKVYEMFSPKDGPATGLNRREFWKHCLAVGCASQMLVQKMRVDADPEEVFVCGLMHDIGKIALEQCLPKSYTRVVEACNRQYGNIADFERKIIGVDHTIAGRRLAQQWHLPSVVEHVIWLHHLPVEGIPEMLPSRPVVGLVHLADTIARELRFGYSGNFTFLAKSSRLANQLNVNASVLQDVVNRLPGVIEQRSRILGMGDTTSENLYRSALASANLELGRLNRKLQQRAGQVVAHERATTLLRKLGEDLAEASSMSSLCSQIASAWAEAGGIETSEADPVAGYLIGSADNAVVLAVKDGGEPHVSLLSHGTSLRRVAPDPSISAAEVLRRLSGDEADVPAWVHRDAVAHRPLMCGRQWIGGLIWPTDATSIDLRDEAAESLAQSMAFAAAVVEARDRGNAMAEQLTQSAQQLYSMRQELTDARALAAVGEMASGAAHELNNPLAVIVGRAELMAESADESDRQTWRTIADQAQRISDIVTEMMEFARPGEPKISAVSPKVLLAEAAELAARNAETGDLRVETKIAAGVPEVRIDRSQVARALLELLSNARAACESDPHVRVEADVDAESGRVRIRIEDDGVGMPPDVLDNAFTPFYSARKAGRRKGLGLSKARRWVELSGGEIALSSQPHQGTVASVFLPTAEDSAGTR